VLLGPSRGGRIFNALMSFKRRTFQPDRPDAKGHETPPRMPDLPELYAAREDRTPLEAAVKAKRRQRGKVARAARKANR
jgi:hypothetical protein